MTQKNYLIKECLELNRQLIELGLAFQTFGNLSLRLDKEHFTIKPSGIDLKKVSSNDFPVVRIKDLKIVDGKLKPSSDTPTHTRIYREYKNIVGVAHTHSIYATSWAQACKEIPILGTTHSDFFNLPIPVTNKLSKDQVKKNYELNTGNEIIKSLKRKKISPEFCPGILVANHGPFSWGKTPSETIQNMQSIEFIAKSAYLSIKINPKSRIAKDLINKHFTRKHGKKSYYGQ